jgi:hypothetical protein
MAATQAALAQSGQEDNMSVESTQSTMLRYFNSEHGDVSMMAEDVVFTVMATGQ